MPWRTDDLRRLARASSTRRVPILLGSILGLGLLPLEAPGLIPIGSLDTPGFANGVRTAGDHAYLSEVEALRVIDVSDPTDPVEVGAVEMPGASFVDVEIVGSLAFVGDGAFGLRIFDVSDPTAPTEIGSFALPSPADDSRDVEVVGSRVFMDDSHSVGEQQLAALRIIDVSDPTTPVGLGSLDLPSGEIHDIEIVGEVAYIVAHQTGDLRVIDVSDPNAPSEIGAAIVEGRAGIEIVGSRLYAGELFALQVLDVSDPTTPFDLGSVATQDNASDLEVAGSLVFMAQQFDGLQVVDVSNPSAPVAGGVLDTPGIAFDLDIVGSRIYVADGPAGLQVVDASSCLSAPVDLEWVTIDSPLNPADTEVMEDGTSGYGSVPDAYRIGRFEVTNAQYAAFLDAVAASDPNGLYNEEMSSSVRGGIHRMGSPGSYSYAVKPCYANKPVVFVSWYDALRFANWLHNGRPTGAQTVATTEDGAYAFTGSTEVGPRRAGALAFLPSEDEWYKAAFYDPSTGAYFDYPTGSDVLPLSEPPPGGSNSANFFGPSGYALGDGFSVFEPPFTEVGAYSGSPSPFGTFDQGGNVSEWNEAEVIVSETSLRGLRGASWDGESDDIFVADRVNIFDAMPTSENSGNGFRVAATLPPPDFDGDGTPDSEDNCSELPNGPLLPDAGGQSQRDTDDDGYGNVCDADLNNDGIVDFLDLGILKSVFFSMEADADADLNGDSIVDFLDLGVMKSLFFRAPGPSGTLP